MDSITGSHSSAYQESFMDPMDDIKDEEFESQDATLSEHARILAEGLDGPQEPKSPTTKVAIIWLKARGEKDPALSSKERNEDRKLNMGILGNQGYDVRFVSSGREYFDTLAKVKERGEKVSEVTFSQHGNPTSCGDFKVRDGRIISVDTTLTPEEQANPLGPLNEVLDEDAVVVFNSCSTGNKSVEDNIGKVASEALPRSKVLAPQHKIVYDPMYLFEEDSKRGGAVVESVQFMYINEEEDRIDPHLPPVYVAGKETTEQEAIPYVVTRNGGWGISSIVNSVANGARNFFAGIGGYFSSTT